MGNSTSSVLNEQDSEAYITQQYSGTCKISCDNKITDADITIINSNVKGGIHVTQSCDVDGRCLFDVTQNASADALAKAVNSANAKNTQETIFGGINQDASTVVNRQKVKAAIDQAINQTCDIQSTDEIDDINIFTANSNIDGGIEIVQKNAVKGDCSMKANMQAVAQASGTANNTAQSGKDLKGELCGGSAIIIMIILIPVVLAILALVAKLISSSMNKKGSGTASQVNNYYNTSPSGMSSGLRVGAN